MHLERMFRVRFAASFPMRIRASLRTLVLVTCGVAWAQVELVDPDASRPEESPAPSLKKRAPQRAVAPHGEGDDSEAVPGPAADEPDDTADLPRPKLTPKVDAGVKNVRKLAPGTKDLFAAPPRPEEEKRPVPAITSTPVSDADFATAWLVWKKAAGSKDVKAEQAARQALLDVKVRSGADAVDLHAIGLVRAAAAAEAAGDSGAAVEMAMTASQLAPDLPAAWVGLARTYFKADPSEVGRYLGALVEAAARTLKDPCFVRPLVANLGTVALVSVVGVAVAVVAVLFLRRARYFFHDFHFLFPRAAARWQTTALAALLLAAPIVFRMGVAPALLALFAAVTLYLSVTERLVAVVLIGLLGAVPTLGELLVNQTAFADTRAEDLYRIERGGPGVGPLVERYEALSQADKADFPEHAVLGRYYLRRGQLELAAKHLRLALALRPDDVACKVNLAAALFFGGDLENSRAILESVQGSGNAAALFNLGRVYKRRIAVYGDMVASELDKANSALAAARDLDGSLPPLGSEELTQPTAGNAYLRTVPLARTELLALAKSPEAATRVRSQLTQMILGDVPEWAAPFFPLAVALMLLAFGFLGPALEAAKVCARCGRPVSRRDDPELSPGSINCTQCINVFVKKNAVAPSMKVRKQLEVARYESRLEKMAYGLGAVWSGMGHVFAGMTVRGTLYGFCFALAVVAVALRQGVLRAPYESLPALLWLVPLGLGLIALYVLSLRGLRRRQS
jgi:tetratricopeptide (TPR) repeat protein